MDSQIKIGTISKMLGITTQTIRYYEKQALIQSDTKDYTATRWFYSKHFLWIMNVRRYIMMGLSSNDIRRIFKCKNPNEVAHELISQKQSLLQQLSDLQSKLDAIQSTINQIDSINYCGNDCQLEYCPEMWALINQHGREIDTSDETLEAMAQISGILHHVRLGGIWCADEFITDHPLTPPQKGFLIPVSLHTNGIRFSDNPLFRHFPSRQCVHMIHKFYTNVRSYNERNNRINEYLNAHHLRIAGDSIRIEITKTSETECFDNCVPNVIYYEYWIPVEKV